MSGEWGRLSTDDFIRLHGIQGFIQKGSFDDAAKLLGEMDETPIVLDLQARLHVQRGMLKAAQALWEKVLQVDPENKSAKDSLRCLSSSWLSKAVAGRCLQITGVAVLSFLAGLGVLFVLGILPETTQGSEAKDLIFTRSDIPHSIAEERVPEVPVVAEVLTQLSSDVKPPESEELLSLNSTTDSVLESPEIPLMPVPAIDIEGVKVSASDNQVSMIFDEGIFRFRCEFSESGVVALQHVAKALSETTRIKEVLVEGHTDNDPVPVGGPYRSNYELGFDRATAVAKWLRSNGALPEGVIRASSGGSEKSPFSNDTYDSRLRNRTVVLHVKYDLNVRDRGEP
jgi:outer membrane protein OmpA-like peptidoglycan-associated protein